MPFSYALLIDEAEALRLAKEKWDAEGLSYHLEHTGHVDLDFNCHKGGFIWTFHFNVSLNGASHEIYTVISAAAGEIVEFLLVPKQ